MTNPDTYWKISDGKWENTSDPKTTAEQRAGRHLLKTIVESQVCTHVMPLDAEAYDWPSLLAAACQELADMSRKPVTLVGKMPGDVCAFQPAEKRKR